MALAGLIVGFPGTLFFGFVGLGMITAFLGIGAAATGGAAAVATSGMESEPSTTPDQIAIQNVPIQGFDDYRVEVKRVGAIDSCLVYFDSLPDSDRITRRTRRTLEPERRKNERKLIHLVGGQCFEI